MHRAKLPLNSSLETGPSNKNRCQGRSNGNYLLFVLLIVIVVIGLNGLRYLTTNAHYSAYFAQGDQVMEELDWFKQHFQLRDSLVILIRDQGALQDDRIALYSQLNKRLKQLPYISRVQSYFSPLLPDSPFGEQEGVREIQELYPQPSDRLEQIQTHPVANTLYRADGNNASGGSGLIVLSVDFPLLDSVGEIQHLTTEAKKNIETAFQQWAPLPEWYLSGVVGLNQAYIDVVRHDLRFFIPGLLLTFTLLLYGLLRSFKVTMGLQLIGLFSVVLSYGLMGYGRISLTAINAFTPVIILTLTIAANMHLVLAYCRQCQLGNTQARAIELALTQTFKPYVFSMLTSAAGFLLLVFSPSPPVKMVGVGVALAMVISLILSRVCLPRLLLSLAQTSSLHQRIQWWFSLTVPGTGNVSWAHRIKVMSGLLLLLGAGALTQLKIDDNVYQYFPEKQAFSQGIKAVEQDFSGVSEMNFALQVTHGHVFGEDYMTRLTDFRQWLELHHGELRLFDIAQVIKQKHLSLTDLYQRLKNNGNSIPGMDQWLTSDLSTSRFVVRVPAKNARELIKLEEEISAWFASHHRLESKQGSGELARGIVLRGGSSPDLAFAHLGQRNAWSMLYSLTLALMVISLLIGAYFRSVSILGIALTVNILPVVMVYGLWTLTGGYISLGCALVMGLVMGLIVDDTLHVLFALKGKTHHWQSLTHKLQNVTPAILLSSLMIVLGLSLGLWSDFTPIRELSLLTILSVVFALFADLVLLPHLLFKPIEQVENVVDGDRII